MLDNIISFSVKNKLVIALFTLGLVVWGGYSLTKLPIDAVPDITNNQVQLITTSPSLAAEEVERLITFPIELEMATIPEIDEIRSFSRFGLSVVTIVFKEHVDVYWARQQVSERLVQVKSQIPPDVGEPSLAPVTTGLGEIYQYVVGTEPGYEDRYDARELRTIQDWIVRRQLLGVPGVADVSSFGGYLKQYEVKLDPNRLNAMNISIGDIFKALESNNENTGGAYIEKGMNAYFIRSEGLVGSLEDIEKIRIKSDENGTPILIRDVATVGIGDAIRYGATTKNGKGEVVSAIVMMLKGENSAEVIDNIKERIEKISKTLPEGVTIRPFLDRSKLVKKAISTVVRNLTEGALIVIFVLLLLLGNLRAGLVVASVIPLALLFAIGMMNVFGVSGNLMSLGAIDFGLIVDGAVIIVEATMHHLGLIKLGRRFTQDEMDTEVIQSASKIRNSAAFGEIIILIVYLPILALVGTEGKMFRPMAETVSFAILGAFILSLTYVPMLSALVLSKRAVHKKNISDKIMDFIQSLYTPTIQWVMHKKSFVLMLSVLLFGFSLFVFSTMGGEFVPTLEEGDFAVETRVMTGSSLKNTMHATTEAEKIILAQFPEVEQVVSKIGAGEIPTDPMPLEAADLMIILKDQSEWVSAKTREGLVEKMAEALDAIPGVAFSFQQPIQMRFNELMTGVRQDVAVKIYGEDLNALSNYAEQIGSLASTVEGAEDVYIEEVTGVPQVVINYKRDQLAKYGLTVKDVNTTVQAAFAGASAGLVYENERRFDLVVRLSKKNREHLESIRNLYVSRNDGHQIPLNQVADVEIKEGPYQIQRDDTRRRILVAFNVRDRDVKSVVNEIKQKIDTSIDFEPGYSVTYGGQFENLVEAQKRLGIAVPIALLLIFILLYFTFSSLKQGVLIFTAIPLAAIGGVFLLWLRDMPFSISAGVGFIALFGVAVLNGIVLISEFNRLKKDGVEDVLERIYQGTKIRLRPVIMTAAVASLGFLPMALSQSAGAEVQKPLATVVIGGLVSATLLTLIVLPILYYYFEKGIQINKKVATIIVLVICASFGNSLNAQTKVQKVDEAIEIAISNNPNLKAADLQTQQERVLEGSAWSVPKTSISMTRGQYNSVIKDDMQFNINQSFAFPTYYSNQKKLASEKVKAMEWKQMATLNELKYQVKSTWYQLVVLQNKLKILEEQDSIYQGLIRAAQLRFESGESNLLEKTVAEARVGEIQVALNQAKSDIEIYQSLLMTLLNSNVSIEPDQSVLDNTSEFIMDSLTIANNPTLAWHKQQVEIAEKEKSVEKSRLLPDLNVGYFNQSLNGPNQDINGNPVVYNSSDRFTGFQVGIGIPIFGLKSQVSSARAYEIKRQENEARYESFKNQLEGELNQLMQHYQKNMVSLSYYNDQSMPQASLIIDQALAAYKEGEIGYLEYTQALSQALTIRMNYLEVLNGLYQSKIQIELLTASE